MKPASPLLQMLVGDLLARWPKAANVLRDSGMASCLGCAMNPFETVGEAARELGVDALQLVAALEKALPRGAK